MIVTFPFEDDPYYSPAPPASYARSGNAALSTPALARKYFDLERRVAGGVFPVGSNRFWHGGVHLAGTGPIRAVADGTIVAYRLDTDYRDSELDRRVSQASPRDVPARPPRRFCGSFVLIRHECELNNGATERHTGAHFYSLYSNLLPQRQLQARQVLPPFLTISGPVAVSALRGDEVTVLAVIDDLHRMVKIRATDVNSGAAAEGWLERMHLDVEPTAALAVSQKVRLAYPVSWLYGNHPTQKQWVGLDSVKTVQYPVRAGEVIGYAGMTDGERGVVPDSFHFEIFAADNLLVKPMKPLVPVDIKSPDASHQVYADGTRCDGMGKVWLTRNASLARDRSLKQYGGAVASDMQLFTSGACFLGAIPCCTDGGRTAEDPELVCFKLFGMDGTTYYAYADAASAAADGRDFVRDAWVTLTTDSDWITQGWQAYEDKELNTTDDGFVEDDDAVMLQIMTAAHKSSAILSLDELHAEGVDVILRRMAVRFHTEWDDEHNTTRYQKLLTGEHPPLPKLTQQEFNGFIQDIQKQQFWPDARIARDGVSKPGMQPFSKPMTAKNWHFHPIGFLAQMRECLTTDAKLSEEAFEQEIRKSWITGLKLIEKRLKQLRPWADANAVMPEPPAARAAVVREYATLHTIHNVRHTELWSNFEYWFGVTPNDVASPETLHGTLPGAPAGHHVYAYLKGMREFFRHISMQRVVKGALGFEAGAWVHPGMFPPKPLVPARSGFQMEYVNIGCQYGAFFRSFNGADPVDQNRMEVQLHEVAHLQNTAHAKDQKIELSAAVSDPDHYNGRTAYGALAARVLAEFAPNRALANAENIAFFIESAKDES